MNYSCKYIQLPYNTPLIQGRLLKIMKPPAALAFMLVSVLALILLASADMAHQAYADTGTFVNEVTFIQYLDENTALEEVNNGNLDIYYYKIPADRIESAESRSNLQVYASTGGSNSILLNPAQTERFNPFQLQEVRFAVNYLVDRKLIVNELMGGYGMPKISNYGPYDPDYLHIIEVLESFNFRYNPILADQMITDALERYGAEKIDGIWHYDGEAVEISMLIRSDDPVRKSIGEILAGELEAVGFVVHRDFGDLNKAFVVVYGSSPDELNWHIYTEGWGSSAFVRYDATGLGQMYSPWFSYMPGYGEPSYWNYENAYLDDLTKSIYAGNFTTSQERINLIQDATQEGIKESVRIFLASTTNQYVANGNVDGIINDFGAGVTTRLTPINVKTDSDTLTVGVKQIYQGAWNPVVGFSDIYSRDIWVNLYDPITIRHPFNGESVPVRGSWVVETAGPGGTLDVPADTTIWNPATQEWESVPAGSNATSRVTFDLNFSNWHHGQEMDISDILHGIYFTTEWGTQQEGDDLTFDSEFTPRASQFVNTFKGFRVMDDDTIQIYVDYWHFDEGEIAEWASVWSSMPWEIFAAMEQAVIDGKTSFSRSGATAKNVSWLSLLIPSDTQMIKEYLESFGASGHVPTALENQIDLTHATARYDAAIEWIQNNDHAVISNGPFYLDGYTPESRLITIRAFDDASYPFEAGHWADFEKVKLPTILSVQIPEIVRIGEHLSIPVVTRDATTIHYFVTNSAGEQILAGTDDITNNRFDLDVSGATSAMLLEGANDIKIFVVSEEVLRPDIYTTSFLALRGGVMPPDIPLDELESTTTGDYEYAIYLIVGIGAITASIVYIARRKRLVAP